MTKIAERIITDISSKIRLCCVCCVRKVRVGTGSDQYGRDTVTSVRYPDTQREERERERRTVASLFVMMNP